MQNSLIFNFKTDISGIEIPEELNNPFGTVLPEIVRIAAKEFQKFIAVESPNWNYDFETQKGKMFGVIVVQKPDNTFGYLGTMSGKFPENKNCAQFVPSVFDVATDDFFINKGMTELAEIGKKIKNSTDQIEINELTETRKQKSYALQNRLLENYLFTTKYGVEKNVIEIFADSAHGNPPAAAGECAAPKLLQFAFSYQLKPIAIAEFWWGNTTKSKERNHQGFYPACKNKCRPILEFMLEDRKLFRNVNLLL